MIRKQYRNALTNYKGLKKNLSEWNADHVKTDEILMQIAARLKEKEILNKNRQIKKEFKALLTGRKPDNHPPDKQKLYLIIHRDILSDQESMENAEAIKPPPSKDFTTGYLRFLKVTRHPDSDYNALIKEEISLTEQIRYLTLPDHKAEFFERRMLRDKNRNVIGVLFSSKR